MDPINDKILMSPLNILRFAHCLSPGCDFRTAQLVSAMSANSQMSWRALMHRTEGVFKVLAIRPDNKEFYTAEKLD